MTKDVSWWRKDLVKTYQYSKEYVMMLSDIDVVSIAYRITEGY